MPEAAQPSADEVALHDLALERVRLARSAELAAPEDAIALAERCDAAAEQLCGRKSRDYATSLQWTALIYRRAAEAKGGGRKAKKELQQAIVLLRESSAILARALGAQHLEYARSLFTLASALASTGGKPDLKEAAEVNVRALGIFWRASRRADLTEHSIAELADLLAAAHARVRPAEGRAAALIAEAISFEEAGAAGTGGPLTPVCHAMRMGLARVLEAEGELHAAVDAAAKAAAALARGIKPVVDAPKRGAGAGALARPKSSAKLSEVETAALEAAAEEARMEAFRRERADAHERASAHAAALGTLGALLRRTGRAAEATSAERSALDALRPHKERHSKNPLPQPAWADGPLAAELARRIADAELAAAAAAPPDPEPYAAASAAAQHALELAAAECGRDSVAHAQVRRRCTRAPPSPHARPRAHGARPRPLSRPSTRALATRAQALRTAAACERAAGRHAEAVGALSEAATILRGALGERDGEYVECMRAHASLYREWMQLAAGPPAPPLASSSAGDLTAS